MPPLSEITQAEISPDLGNILRLAASTHTKLSDVDTGTGERFNINFASLFVAFLTVDRPDPVSRWFRAYAKAANIDTVAILAKERVGEAAAIDVSQQVSRSSTPVEASIDKALADLYLTQSAGGILREAETIRQSRQLRYLDCQLIMGVLVYRAPVDHPDNLEIWRFNKVDWAADYLTFLFAFNPSEIPYWQKYYGCTRD